jgi:hypothetical protein
MVIGVGVQGHRYGRVPEELLDELRVDPSAQEQRGARVPDVVETDVGQASLLEERLEGTLDQVLGVQGRSRRVTPRPACHDSMTM